MKRMMKILMIFIDEFYLLINEVALAIIEEDLESATFYDVIDQFVDATLARFTIELREFSAVHSSATYKFYLKLEEVTVAILQDVNFYLFESSKIAN